MALLNARQMATLRALSNGERSSYPGLSIGTLNALLRRRLVACRHEPGSLYFPQNKIKWKLTDTGRQLVEISERGER